MRLFSLTLLIIGFAGTTPAIALAPSKTSTPKAPADVIFETDIAYRSGYGRWLLNVIQPREKSADRRPAVVLVHGGGWTGGTHYGFSRKGFMLAQQGYVVILPTYRMIKDGPFPAYLHDVKKFDSVAPRQRAEIQRRSGPKRSVWQLCGRHAGLNRRSDCR